MKWWQKPAPCWLVCVLAIITLVQFVALGYEHTWNQQQQVQIEEMPAELAVQVSRLSELIGELQEIQQIQINNNNQSVGVDIDRQRIVEMALDRVLDAELGEQE